MGFFRVLEWALDEISQDSLDDYIMTRRLAEWRKLMADFEIEVPAIGKSLHRFVDFIFSNDSRPGVRKEVQDILEEINAGIARVKVRLDEAYSALRSDMQFTESRRSIIEAKTVTKLTELAFLFIPLSFTSFLFSMSILELQNGVPIWTFVVTSPGMALLSYGVRQILASDFIADSSRSALEHFWARRNVRRGDDAPILVLIYLTIQEVWRNGGSSFLAGCGLFLFISAFIVVPVAFLWTATSLDVGFNVAMTLLLISSGFAFAWSVAAIGESDVGERVTRWFNRGADTESEYEDV